MNKKDCPFCGGDTTYPILFRETMTIECGECGAWGSRIEIYPHISDVLKLNRDLYDEYVEQAWNAWNKRFIESEEK